MVAVSTVADMHAVVIDCDGVIVVTAALLVGAAFVAQIEPVAVGGCCYCCVAFPQLVAQIWAS